MGFYDKAVNVLETIARALRGAFSYGSMAVFYDRSQAKPMICPEFSKTAVRTKKHIRPPIRAEPETMLHRSKSNRQQTNTFSNLRRIILWDSLLLPFLRCLLWLLLWALALAYGVWSTSWKVTVPTTLLPMLMCHKVTHKKLIDNSPLFRKNFKVEFHGSHTNCVASFA